MSTINGVPVVDREEWMRHNRIFRMMDADGNKVVDKEEWARMAQVTFNHLDTDGDGCISLPGWDESFIFCGFHSCDDCDEDGCMVFDTPVEEDMAKQPKDVSMLESALRAVQEEMRRREINRIGLVWDRILRRADNSRDWVGKVDGTLNELSDSWEDFTPSIEYFVDLFGVGLTIWASIFTLTDKDGVDWVNLVPLMTTLFVIGRKTFGWSAIDVGPTDISGDSQILYQLLFASGCEAVTVGEFQRFLRASKARYEEFPAGSVAYDDSQVGVQLKIVVRGLATIYNTSALVGKSETRNIVGPGSFVGGGGFFHTDTQRGSKGLKSFDVVSTKEMCTVSWNCDVLRKYISTDPVMGRKLRNLFGKAMLSKAFEALASKEQLFADIDEVFDRIIEAAKRHLRAERASAYILESCEEHGLSLCTHAATGVVGRKAIRVPLYGKSLAAEAARRNQIMAEEDCYSNPQFDASLDKKTGFRTRNVVSAPLRHPDNPAIVIGVLQVLNRPSGVLDEGDARVMSTLSLYASLLLARVFNCRGVVAA